MNTALVPSQVLQQQMNNSSNNENASSSHQRRRGRRSTRRGRKKTTQSDTAGLQSQHPEETMNAVSTTCSTTTITDNHMIQDQAGQQEESIMKTAENSSNRCGNNKKSFKKEKDKQKSNQLKNNDNGKGNNSSKSKNTSNNKGKQSSKKFPWRKEIPEGSVDPISLEPLNKLPYPPFALKITPPYDPIPVWPIPEKVMDTAVAASETTTNNILDQSEKDMSKREQQFISEQWGHLLSTSSKNNNIDSGKKEIIEEQSTTTKEQCPKLQNRHVHLYDGRVLALYLVSTLQFIDPLNRRDLTREEIKNLDDYLAKHGLKKMRVLDAYSEKGISLSSAGANAQTPHGRLQIRQEEARNILNAIFSHHDRSTAGTATSATTAAAANSTRRRGRGGRRGGGGLSGGEDEISQMYASHQASEHRLQNNNNAPTSYTNTEVWDMNDVGIFGDQSGGLLIIDDDLNPGLRGGGLDRAVTPHNFPILEGGNGNGGGDAVQQMDSWYGHRARVHADNFPALPRPTLGSSEVDDTAQSSGRRQVDSSPKPVKVSKSLSKISKLVQKTDPKQLEKQRRARELALKKAELASLPYEDAVRRLANSDNGSIDEVNGYTAAHGLLPVPSVTSFPEPSEGQLLRNRNLATALGVAPSTVRENLLSGWSRPTDIPKSVDEFGNELNTTQYPDSLIIDARERMTELLRLEKKWLSFLKDDKSASCSLKPMDKPTRKFVHEYSDFWSMHTQSFDPQPNRYVHCVKLLETRAPRPLLSEVARTWRGSVPPKVIAHVKEPTIPMEHMEGEDSIVSSTREFLRTDERTPLRLEPRSLASGVMPPPGAMFDLDVESRAASKNDLVSQPAPRFAPLLAERERPKLNLQPRTKPLELPKYQPPKKSMYSEISNNLDMHRQAEVEKKNLQDEKNKNIFAALASDASDEEGSDSDWEVGEALVKVSDDEE